jgi:limonene-1,2-epoxide hydrolase
MFKSYPPPNPPLNSTIWRQEKEIELGGNWSRQRDCSKISENREYAEFILKAQNSPDELDDTDWYRFVLYAYGIDAMWEDACISRKRELIDEEFWLAWDGIMRFQFIGSGYRKFWNAVTRRLSQLVGRQPEAQTRQRKLVSVMLRGPLYQTIELEEPIRIREWRPKMARNMNPPLCIIAMITMLSAPVGAVELTEEKIRAYYAAWTEGNLENLMSYFTADAVYEDVATGDLSTGKEKVRAFAKKFLDGTPGVKVEPTSILVGKDSAAVEWTMSAGTGDEAWSVRGVAILKHRDGQITRATDYWNSE